MLEGSNQWSDPPLLKLEPADGLNAPDTGPDRTDFFYPHNSRLQQPIVLRSYFGNQEVFRLNNLRRVRSGALVFDIKLAPKVSPANMLANPSFESAAGGHTRWLAGRSLSADSALRTGREGGPNRPAQCRHLRPGRE